MTAQKIIFSLSLPLFLSACQPDRLAMIGKPPPITHIKNPVQFKNYRPVTMPMPSPKVAVRRVNSLWQDGATSFFKDQRARQIGDILTVQIRISDNAKFENNSAYKRDPSSLTRTVSTLAGYQRKFKNLLPNGVSPANLFGFSSKSDNKGDATVERKEKVDTKIAATVTQVLPNGNMVIWGRQEFLLNNDVRDVTITGIVRPEDITSKNRIAWDKVAEARIAYGGRGQAANIQAPPIGQQIVEAVSPF